MKVTVKGIVLEKFKKQGRNNEEKYYLRLYQVGQKMNIDVNVSSATFGKAKQGEQIELQDISVGAYVFNNSAGMYAKEEF